MQRKPYDRHRDVPRLLAVWEEDLNDVRIAARKRFIAKLEQACRRERKRGLEGHFAYSLANHRALILCLVAEKAELRAMMISAGEVVSPELEMAS